MVALHAGLFCVSLDLCGRSSEPSPFWVFFRQVSVSFTTYGPVEYSSFWSPPGHDGWAGPMCIFTRCLHMGRGNFGLRTALPPLPDPMQLRQGHVLHRVVFDGSAADEEPGLLRKAGWLREAEEADEAVAEAVAEVGSRGGLRRLMRLWLRRLRRQRRLRRRGRSLSLGTSLPFCTLSSLSQGEAPEGIPEVGDWGEAPEGIPASTCGRSFSLGTLLSVCTLSSALSSQSSTQSSQSSSLHHLSFMNE